MDMQLTNKEALVTGSTAESAWPPPRFSLGRGLCQTRASYDTS